MGEQKPTFSEWLSFIAISISAIALILSAWQAFMFREHNKLTVRPILDFEKQYFKEKNEYWVSVVIKNDGFGPAIIDSNLLTFDNKTIDESRLYHFVKRLGLKFSSEINQIQAGAILKPGESIEILKFDTIVFSRTKKNKYSVAYREFYEMDIQVHYHTLYGDKLVASKRLGKIFPDHAAWIEKILK